MKIKFNQSTEHDSSISNKDVKQMGCVTISRNGYVQELEEQLRQERELADKLAVELTVCYNTWRYDEEGDVVKVLKMWRELRGK